MKKKYYYIGTSTVAPEKGDQYQFWVVNDYGRTIWYTVPKVQKVVKLSDNFRVICWGMKVAFVKITRR